MGDLPKNVKKHGSGYRAVFTVDGKQTRSQTFKTLEDAAAWAAAYRKASKTDRESAVLTLGEAHDRVVEIARQSGGRAGTLRPYSSNRRYLEKFFEMDRPIHLVTAEKLNAWRDHLRANGISESTIFNILMRWMRRLVRFALARGTVMRDPFLDFIMARAPQQKFGTLPSEEVRRILRLYRDREATTPAYEHDADICELLFLTGLRRGELARLRPCDIDMDAGTIQVDGKNGARQAVISKPVRPILERMMRDRAPEEPLVTRSQRIDKACTRFREKLGITEWHPHLLRHSFATALARAEIDPWKLARLMGHTSVAMTTRYYAGEANEAKDLLDQM